MSVLKSWIRQTLRRRGYLVQKYPISEFKTVPVFDLSVRLLMAIRGEQVTFVQVGANDGRYGDPLHDYISRHPWEGILVEPQPDLFTKLRENYAAAADRLIFENVAIAQGVGELAMYRGKNGGPSDDGVFAASVVSASPQVVARQLGVQIGDLERFTVPCATLDDLVVKHGLSGLDLLQIDTEGHDYNVLKTLDLSKTRPWIIQFEHGHLTPREITGALEHLNGHGYRVLFGGHQTDTLALREDFLEPHSP